MKSLCMSAYALAPWYCSKRVSPPVALRTKSLRILLLCVSLDISWECLALQVLSPNDLKHVRLLLVWAALDISCGLAWWILSRNHAKTHVYYIFGGLRGHILGVSCLEGFVAKSCKNTCVSYWWLQKAIKLDPGHLI